MLGVRSNKNKDENTITRILKIACHSYNVIKENSIAFLQIPSSSSTPRYYQPKLETRSVRKESRQWSKTCSMFARYFSSIAPRFYSGIAAGFWQAALWMQSPLICPVAAQVPEARWGRSFDPARAHVIRSKNARWPSKKGGEQKEGRKEGRKRLCSLPRRSLPFKTERLCRQFNRVAMAQHMVERGIFSSLSKPVAEQRNQRPPLTFRRAPKHRLVDHQGKTTVSTLRLPLIPSRLLQADRFARATVQTSAWLTLIVASCVGATSTRWLGLRRSRLPTAGYLPGKRDKGSSRLYRDVDTGVIGVQSIDVITSHDIVLAQLLFYLSGLVFLSFHLFASSFSILFFSIHLHFCKPSLRDCVAPLGILVLWYYEGRKQRRERIFRSGPGSSLVDEANYIWVIYHSRY